LNDNSISFNLFFEKYFDFNSNIDNIKIFTNLLFMNKLMNFSFRLKILILLTIMLILLFSKILYDVYITKGESLSYKTTLFERKTPADLDEVTKYIERVKKSVENKEILNLLTLDNSDKELFEIIKKDASLLKIINKDTNLRNELFGVYTPKLGDISEKSREICKDSNCKRIEIFNFATNTSYYVLAHKVKKAIVDVQSFVNFQPELPPHLKDLAILISSKDKKITEFVGFELQGDKALMANTKTALNKSVCERSQHVCVSPTYIMPYKMALWAIVDLTDLNLVAIRWTNLVNDGSNLPDPNTTEKKTANEVIDQKYCQKTNKFEQGDWKFNYTLTSSDGMNIENVTYKGKEVIKSTKLVDWHVSYSKEDGFGYSDAIGCPVYSQAAVVAAGDPLIKQKDGYVEFHQEYWSEGWPKPCNYYYEQALRLYDNGAFRPIATSIGRGCGTDGTYRPVTRIELGKDLNSISKFNGNDFVSLDKEDQFEQSKLKKDTKNFSFRTGQFGVTLGEAGLLDPKERGDNAFVYFSNNNNKNNEGDNDIPTIGSCCNTDLDQGPNKFVNNEKLESEGTVMWYVPQLKNDGAKDKEFCWADTKINPSGTFDIIEYPCHAGPLFTPINN
jgi:hypothetical protein